jgi:hypothetical protein
MRPEIRKAVRFVGLGGALTAAMIAGAGVWFVVSHRTSVVASAQRADLEFSALRTRFGGQEPLLDMGRLAAGMPVASAGIMPIRTFHTVIFDTRNGQRLVRIDVPYWFARLFAGRNHEFVWLGQLTFLDDTEFDAEPIRLPLAQVERRGPGLIAYYRHPGGGQFISWVE